MQQWWEYKYCDGGTSLGSEEEAYKTKNDEMISVLYIPELYNRKRNGVG